MAKPILDKAMVIYTWRMSSVMAVRAHWKTAQLVNWVFIIVNILRMLGSSVKVRIHACILYAFVSNNNPTMFFYFPKMHVQMAV